MALKTILAYFDGVSDIERSAGGGGALVHDLRLARVFAELVDDVGFPIGGSVLEIRGIQSGFLIGLIGVVGIILAEIVKRGCGSVEGNGFRNKAYPVPGVLLKQRGQIRRGIVADRFGAGHHQLRLPEDFAACIADQEGVRELRDQKTASRENDDQDQIEFGQELHGCSIPVRLS